MNTCICSCSYQSPTSHMSTMQAQSLPLEATRLLQLDVTRGYLNSIEQDEAKQLCKVCPARLVADLVHEPSAGTRRSESRPSQAGMPAACELQSSSLSIDLTARSVPAPFLSVLSCLPHLPVTWATLQTSISRSRSPAGV